MTPSEQRIIALLETAESKMSPQALVKEASALLEIDRTEARKMIRSLVDRQEITYTYDFGSTWVELSFLKPVRISQHFVLKPPGTENPGHKPSDIEIILEPGIAFGSGSHPTTRLCLRAIDDTLLSSNQIVTSSLSAAMDLGTGSGVLALAMVKAGISRCLAVDTDLNCVSEAKRNIILNGLQHQIHVTDHGIENLDTRFSIICANLRFPTLIQQASCFRELTEPAALLIFSGIRPWETKELLDDYQQQGFHCINTAQEKNWAGVTLIKQ